ncbi:MAG TPA: universal stress protein [Pyrinomonadaceae bacterium]|jgi:Universal stress protein UspA and related nucleotide-binding proteins|nr:universal stress protein [Pyrinomonadaceae bacterium]
MEDQDSIIQSVLHPTDFSEGSKVAFHHALKIALLAKSGLTLLNVTPDGTSEWSEFPGVRETLERWELLPKGSQRSAVGELGIDASKVFTQESDPVEAVLRYLKKHPADLIVLATNQHDGRARWLGKSVAEPVARKAWEMSLFIPGDSDGFVDARDGSVHLSKILIPVARSPRPQPAVEAAARLVEKFKCTAGTFVLMHVGDSRTMPTFRRPEVAGWEWKQELRTGEVIQSIVDAAKDLEADLIVMSTDGRNGFLDSLRGSHSERVLRHGAAPLLTIPVGPPA